MPRVNEYVYRRTFNTKFNLGFGLPLTDTCATCDKVNLQLSSGTENQEAAEEPRLHQEKAEQGYQSTSRQGSKAGQAKRVLGEAPHRTKDALDIISFDFQQNLPTPTLHHNDVFYARQLWTYNFGIHDCVSGHIYMYM